MNRIRETLSERQGFLVSAGYVAAILVAYFPGLGGPFVFDDAVNITDADAVAVDTLSLSALMNAVTANTSGFLGRPLATISFSLNYYFAGGFSDSLPFKLTNLVIHIFNSLLVYWLARQFVDLANENQRSGRHTISRWFAPVVGAVWALHPIQLTSVLYVVQRMTSLSAFFVLLGLICFVTGRKRLRYGQAGALPLVASGLFGGALLGILCKENAALILYYALVIEYIFFRVASRNETDFRKTLTAVTGVLTGFAVLWLLLNPGWIIDGYRPREFSLGERLLTETRVLWYYLGLLVFPASSRFSLFHDDFIISTGLFSPWSTAPSVLLLLTAVFMASSLKDRHPVPSFAVLWYVVGHSMESSLIGLELVHEHRNYLPIFGPVVGLCYAAFYASKYIQTPQLKTALWALVLLALGFSTHALARVWADKQTLVQFMVWHHPSSARSHAALAEFQLHERRQPLEAIIHFEQAARLAPHETAYPIQVAMLGAYLNAHMTDFRHIHDGEAGNTRNNPSAYIEVDRSSNPPGILLNSEIHRIISEKLHRYPIHARTVTSLLLVSECIRQQQAICGRLLGAATSWFRIALDNSTTDGNRAALIMGLVGLMVSQGNFDEAIRLGELAHQYKPDAAGIAIMQADVYFQADMQDKARAIIQDLQRKGPHLSAGDHAQIRNLLNKMEKDRNSRPN